MKEQEIGELYQQKLAGYQSQPPAGMWEKIQQDAAMKKFTRRRQLRYWGVRVVLPVLIVAAVVAVLLIANKDTQTSNNQNVVCKNTTVTEVKTAPLASNSSQNSVTVSTSGDAQHAVVLTQKQTASHTAPATSPTVVPARAQEAIIAHTNENSTVSPYNPTMPTVVTKHNKPVSTTGNHGVTNGKETYYGDPIAVGHADIDKGNNSLIISPDTLVCRNSSVNIYVRNAQNVWWSFGSQNPSETIIVEEPILVEATVHTLEGKDTVVRINIGVYDCELFIPTAFTPNDDGLNDEWIVYAPATFTDFDCSVYDKSGRMLFHSRNIHQGWNGKTGDGKYMTTGAYFYVCSYRDEMGQKRVQKGQVTLIR